ncbi:MAG: NAD(+)/NADH kinase [Clostridia bacterium]|nr:NAD(+)/NADH kinase [Clostridia bacterium]
MLKTIGIYVNTDKDTNMSCDHIAQVLVDNGFTPRILSCAGLCCKTEEIVSFIKNVDAVFTLGGDGTLLMISKLCARFQVPVLGINLGRVGFLSEVELMDVDKAIRALKNGEYVVNNRMMLECRVEDKVYYALNEVVLHRDMAEHMLNIKLSAREQSVGSFYADGVLVASPTGSTAYNLSAGGPIAAPDAEVMLLTPISAHTLRARPYVFSAKEVLQINGEEGIISALAIDGAQVKRGDGITVTVRRAEFDARFISLKNKNFYSVLSSKLNEWSTVE